MVPSRLVVEVTAEEGDEDVVDEADDEDEGGEEEEVMGHWAGVMRVGRTNDDVGGIICVGSPSLGGSI